MGEFMIDGWLIEQLLDRAAGLNGNEVTKQRLRAELNDVASGVAGPNPIPLVLMLAQTAALSWFALRLYEAIYASASISEEGISLAESEHLQRIIDRAHKRHLSTLKSLATVRRLIVSNIECGVETPSQAAAGSG
jgi:hypothetical protein